MGNIDSRLLMVSIRCATYNHAPYIRQCLDGFVMQKTNFRFEAIVHDDASTDGTTEIVREYAEKYPDIIKPMYEKENQYSKNLEAMDAAINARLTGKYVAICEGDDFWTDPNKLQKQVDILEQRKDCSIALCRIQMITKDNQALDITIPLNNSIREGIVKLDDFLKEEFYNLKWCFHTSSFLFRRAIYEKYMQIRKTEFKFFPFGDMPLLLTCLLEGDGYFFSNIGGYYRIFSGGYNSSTKNNPTKAIKREQMLIKALEVFDEHTNFQYHKYIKRRVEKSEINICKIDKNYISLIKFKYWWFFLDKVLCRSRKLSKMYKPLS